MARISALMFLALAPLVAAQAADSPVQLQWQVEASAVAGSPAHEVDVVFTAQIPEEWILYASDFSAELGPRPTRFHFQKSEAYEVVGPTQSIGAQRRKDRNLGTEYRYFAGRAEFHQRVRLTGDRGAELRGSIEGQTCQEKDGLCSLFTHSFDVQVP